MAFIRYPYPGDYSFDMRIIGRDKLERFWNKHRDAQQQLQAWYEDAEKAIWETPLDIASSYANARTIKNNRAIFNIKGGNYRLVVAIRYKSGVVLIRFVGTHKEYDKVDAAEV